MIEKTLRNFVTDAIKSIYPLATPGFMTGDTYASLKWFSEDLTKPTEDEWDTALAKVQSDWTAQAYARDRATSYPSVGDQLDMLMKDMRDRTETHQTACEAVKLKYPKPS